jgi:hypothetical protein
MYAYQFIIEDVVKCREEMNRARYGGRGAKVPCHLHCVTLQEPACVHLSEASQNLSFWAFLETSLHSYN